MFRAFKGFLYRAQHQKSERTLKKKTRIENLLDRECLAITYNGCLGRILSPSGILNELRFSSISFSLMYFLTHYLKVNRLNKVTP